MLISHWSEFSHMAILRQKKRLGIVFILGGHVSSNKKRANGRWETSISFCHDYNEESLKLTLRNVGPWNHLQEQVLFHTRVEHAHVTESSLPQEGVYSPQSPRNTESILH